MTTSKKNFSCTPQERKKIMEWLARCRDGAETARDNLREGVGRRDYDWVIANIKYWDSVAKGFTWSMGMLRKGDKKDAVNKKASSDVDRSER